MRTGWSDEELKASVEAYQQMLKMDSLGQRYVKADIYRELAERFDRSAKAFEYRMQNISALYHEQGLEWVTGLKPAGHIGTEVRTRLIPLITTAAVSTSPGRFKYGDKRTWEIAVDAIVALGGSAKRSEVRDWIIASYPSYNTGNLIDLEFLSVNSPSRTSHSNNGAARRTDSGSPYDMLFMSGSGRKSVFELYSPQIHGVWEIYPDASAGNQYGLGIRLVESPSSAALAEIGIQEERGASFSPESIEDARDKVLTEIYRRRGQTGFRNALLRAYENTCAITGCLVLPLLEAAHIHPYKGPHTNSVSNGLLLRADIHTLFDLYLIAIDSSSMTTLIAPALKATEYAELSGCKIRLPLNSADRPSLAVLDWHRALCAWT